MGKLDNKKCWVLKNQCLWTVVLEKTLESLLDSKQIQPVHPKGNQPWIFFGRTDAEAEAPILWPPDAKSWINGKDSILGKTEGRRRKGWQRMRWLMASLTQWMWVWASSGKWWRTGNAACYNSQGHKESDVTKWLSIHTHLIVPASLLERLILSLNCFNTIVKKKLIDYMCVGLVLNSYSDPLIYVYLYVSIILWLL